MEKSDIKNASLIICFEKSTYEKIQKGMVFSYKTSPISRFRSCLCFMFLKHLNRAKNQLKSGYGTDALILLNMTIIISLKDFFFFSLRRLRQQPDKHSASRLLSPKVDTAQTNTTLTVPCCRGPLDIPDPQNFTECSTQWCAGAVLI